jgi:CRP-like cAMP-binding protein
MRGAVRAGAVEDRTLAENTEVFVRDSFERTFDVGETIFEESDSGETFFIIHSGEIELSRMSSAGRRTVARLGPGEFFGEMSVVLGEPRTSRAAAVKPSRLLALDGETLEAMCVEQPEIAIRIISRLSSRLKESERRLAALGVDDLLRPVVRALVRGAEKDPEHGIRIETTLRGLSDDAGLSMLETHRALHQLLDRKLLRLVDDVLVASDVESLSASLEVAA